MMKLIREIRNRKGDLHFRRWSLISTKWFNVYVHGIYKADEDEHLHDHPWNYLSIVLKGMLSEVDSDGNVRFMAPLSFSSQKATRFHKILWIKGPVYTLFFTGKRYREWGYDVDGKWVDNASYRINKSRNSG